MEVLPFEDPADRVYGVLRAGLEQKGQPIGGNDLLIAAKTAKHYVERALRKAPPIGKGVGPVV